MPVLDVSIAQLTDCGGRPANEDALGVRTLPGGSCFVLSDGAGGHAGGATAAQIVVDSVLQAFSTEPAFDRSRLAGYIAVAEERLLRARVENRVYADMTATFAVLLLDETGDRALWAHLGDTRICHFRRGVLQASTRDHSMVQRLVDAGLLSPDRVGTHPSRNLLYAAIGTEGSIPAAVAAEPVVLEDGDALLLCTDGFWGPLDTARMERALRLAGSPEEWLDGMRRSLLQSGTPGDNYSAIAVWVGSPEEITVIDLP
jgi:serine/threonine protein phosphatase PrpC